MSRLVRVEVDLKRFKKYGAFLRSKIEGTGAGSLTAEIKNFGQEILGQVLDIYRKTASWEDEAVRKRIYKYGTDNPMAGVLAHQLNYTDVARSANQWVLSVTNPTMYPLGGGHPYYALWQEHGSAGNPMTSYTMRYIIRNGVSIPIIHPGLPARQFIQTGYIYAQNNARKMISKVLNRWVKEARGV